MSTYLPVYLTTCLSGALQLPKPAARFLFLLLVFTSPCYAQWSEEELKPAREFHAGLDSGGLVVLHQGETVVSWGDVSTTYNVASIRKALLNSLYGVAYDRNWIDLHSSLADLGIDDTDPPLSEQEKTATVEDLLRSRSGIVHRSLYEAGWWEDMPERNQYKPGEYWIYNNWDFNALGTIFTKATERTIHDAFQEFIAGPIGMEDFQPDDVEYQTRNNLAERMRGNTSDHNLYLFMMSARDLARYGQLYLQQGEWNGETIISREWINKTMAPVRTEFKYPAYDTGYGYLWWIESGDNRRISLPSVSGTVWMATGNRGHYIYIVPGCELVIAHTAPTTGGAGALSQIARRYFGTDGISGLEFARLVELLVGSQGDLKC